MECDIFNFAETSVNWKHVVPKENMIKPVKKKIPISRLNIGRNKFRSSQPTLPGGAAQVIAGDWTGRIVSYVHDSCQMRRWCGVKLRLKHNRNILIICAYRVCNQSLTQVGPETAYSQQKLMLTLDALPHTNPRDQFNDNFINSIKQWKHEYDDVLLVWDANEPLATPQKVIVRLMHKCRLINLFHHHHGVCPSFPTYERGQQRLDYMIGSSTLLPFITRCRYLPFFMGVQTDHRGLFIEFSLELVDGLTRLE